MQKRYEEIETVRTGGPFFQFRHVTTCEPGIHIKKHVERMGPNVETDGLADGGVCSCDAVQ